MDIVTTICVFMFGTVYATDSQPKVYSRGENVTVHIDHLELNETNVVEITFSGYTSKLHVSNVMMYNPVENHTVNISIDTNYTGRIERIQVNERSFSFLLLNVNFVDSGNYTAIEASREKGKTSILVPRHRLLGQNSETMIVPFTCNMTNVTSIEIEMMLFSKLHLVVKYDVTRENYTEIGSLHSDRIEGCVLNGSTFSFTIRKVSFLDKGMYVAWGDMDYLMDSVFVDLEEDVTSSFIPNLSRAEAEHHRSEWFLASTVAVVVVFVVASVVIIGMWKLRQKKSPQVAVQIGPSSTITLQSETEDREYEEPLCNRIELTVYSEPLGIQTEDTENVNPNASCNRVYEKLHPYENQGNNMYSSVQPEHINEV